MSSRTPNVKNDWNVAIRNCFGKNSTEVTHKSNEHENYSVDALANNELKVETKVPSKICFHESRGNAKRTDFQSRDRKPPSTCYTNSNKMSVPLSRGHHYHRNNKNRTIRRSTLEEDFDKLYIRSGMFSLKKERLSYNAFDGAGVNPFPSAKPSDHPSSPVKDSFHQTQSLRDQMLRRKLAAITKVPSCQDGNSLSNDNPTGTPNPHHVITLSRGGCRINRMRYIQTK